MGFQAPLFHLISQTGDVLRAQQHEGIGPRTHHVTGAFQVEVRVRPHRGQPQPVPPSGHFPNGHVKRRLVRFGQNAAPVQRLACVVHQRRLPLCTCQAFPGHPESATAALIVAQSQRVQADSPGRHELALRLRQNGAGLRIGYLHREAVWIQKAPERAEQIIQSNPHLALTAGPVHEYRLTSVRIAKRDAYVERFRRGPRRVQFQSEFFLREATVDQAQVFDFQPRAQHQAAQPVGPKRVPHGWTPHRPAHGAHFQPRHGCA